MAQNRRRQIPGALLHGAPLCTCMSTAGALLVHCTARAVEDL